MLPCAPRPASQTMLVMRRFKIHTLISIAALLIVHAAAFVTMMVLLVSVQDSITDLNSSGRVGKRGLMLMRGSGNCHFVGSSK